MASASAAKQGKELSNLMIEVARTQLAAVGAALKFWGGWVQSADQYTQKINDELSQISDGSANRKEFAGRVSDLTREYLRNIISLPNQALDHFAQEMEKIAQPPAKRARKARAKA